MLDPENLKELLELVAYDPSTGLITWKKSWRPVKRQPVTVGAVASVKTNHGYQRVNYKRQHIMAHQLAWLIVHGELPKEFIDHKDRNRCNNRIDNLRVVNKVQNGQNRTLNRNNKTGIMGVTLYQNGKHRGCKYCATITVEQKQYTRYFATIEEAATWRAEMVNEHFEKIT